MPTYQCYGAICSIILSSFQIYLGLCQVGKHSCQHRIMWISSDTKNSYQCWLPQLECKTLLQKTQNTYGIEKWKNKADNQLKFYHSWLELIVLNIAIYCYLRSNHWLCSATKPGSYDDDLPKRYVHWCNSDMNIRGVTARVFFSCCLNLRTNFWDRTHNVNDANNPRLHRMCT